jgi:hypothetical protein
MLPEGRGVNPVKREFDLRVALLFIILPSIILFTVSSSDVIVGAFSGF